MTVDWDVNGFRRRGLKFNDHNRRLGGTSEEEYTLDLEPIDESGGYKIVVTSLGALGGAALLL